MRCFTPIAAALAVVNVAFAQEVVDEATFGNLIQYTRFSRAAYAARCATPPNGSVAIEYLSDAVNDGQAAIFRWDLRKQIVVAFRGTSTPKDWDIDLNYGLQNLTVPGADCAACQVSIGFQTQYLGIAQQVLTGVKNALRGYCDYDIVLTGHSLGGALSALASISLSKNGLRPAKVYTYGEPRNGNQEYSTYIENLVGKENYLRITHSNDGVPQFPPASLGLAHHGNEYWQKNTGFNVTRETTYYCPAGAAEVNAACNSGQNYGDLFINYGHVTYSNDVTGNALHVHDCGAPYPGASTQA